jgi:hypothetical protein
MPMLRYAEEQTYMKGLYDWSTIGPVVSQNVSTVPSGRWIPLSAYPNNIVNIQNQRPFEFNASVWLDVSDLEFNHREWKITLKRLNVTQYLPYENPFCSWHTELKYTAVDYQRRDQEETADWNQRSTEDLMASGMTLWRNRIFVADIQPGFFAEGCTYEFYYDACSLQSLTKPHKCMYSDFNLTFLFIETHPTYVPQSISGWNNIIQKRNMMTTLMFDVPTFYYLEIH